MKSVICCILMLSLTSLQAMDTDTTQNSLTTSQSPAVSEYLAQGIPVAIHDLGWTWRYLICHAGTALMVALWINHGANVNMTDHCDRTPLYIHTCFGLKRLSSIIALLMNGASIHKTDTSGWTPLHRAIFQITANPQNNKTNFPVFLALFAKYGANFNARNSSGNTPLHLAIAPIGENIEEVKALICYGARLDIVNKKGKTPLDHARACKYYEPYLESLEDMARNQAIEFINKLLAIWTVDDAGVFFSKIETEIS